ncbi:MAG: Ig-like domain-containing protein [Opitutaceae bacterium]|nr:Ig-like domain-containing protein [Opitutaceae bacterium]
MNAALVKHAMGVAGVLALFLTGEALGDQATVNLAQTRHALNLNSGVIEGSIQQMRPEGVTINGGAVITGDLLVPGTPVVRLNGHPSYGGTLDGSGNAAPSNYQVTLNGSCAVRHVIRRIDPLDLPAVSAPPFPAGARNVTISAPNQDPGDFQTLRNLTLNGDVGQVIVPPGTYGDFTANGGSGFTLGVAGATQPAVYNLQRLTLNGQARIQLVGPVIVTVAHGFAANGTVGSTANPAWLALNIYSGGFTLNGGCAVHGFVNAPNGTVIVNGASQLVGGVACDRLTINGGGLLHLVEVAVLNQPPMAVDQAVTLNEDTTAGVVLGATDADGDPLTYSLTAAPAHGALSGAAPNLTYTPDTNYHGTDSLKFTANDGQADSNEATVTIAVTPVNDAPVADPKNVTGAEDTAIAIELSGSDVDGDALGFTVTTPPAHGSLSGAGADLIYTPAADYNGPDSFTYTAGDGSLNSSPAAVAITVTPVNDAPAVNSQSLAVNEGSELAVTLTGSDVDGDSLAYMVLTQPTHGTLSGAAPNLAYQPAANYGGPDSLTFKANDGTVDSNIGTIAIEVTNLNDPPFANSQSIAAVEDTPAEVTLAGSDPDGDPITFVVVTPPAHGTLSGAGAHLTYAPAPDYHGPDGFTFKTRDAEFDSAIATVEITVAPVNDAPAVNAQAITTDEDTATPITLTGADVDGDVLTYAVVTPPAHGTLGGAAPLLTYTPEANYHGADTFTFKAGDSQLESAPAAVAITINPVNDAPVVAAQSLTTAEDTPLTVTLGGTDVEGSTLVFTVLTPPAHGALAGDAPNLTYTPAENYHGPDSFTFRVNDGELDSEPAAIALAVTPVNDPPVGSDQTVAIDEDGTTTLTLAGADPDEDPLTFIIVTQPAHGVLTGTAPNLTYTPAANFSGQDSFTYKITDGVLECAPATVIITVTEVNDPPTANAQSVATAEDSSVAIALSGADPEGAPLTFVVTVSPAHGALSGAAPILTYTPAPDYHGADSFAFKASDGQIDSAEATVAIAVSPVNDPPTANPQSVTTDEDTPVSLTLSGQDPEGATLAYVVTVPPAHGTLGGAAPDLVYTPAADFNGADSFAFKVSDGEADSAEAAVSLSVSPVNDPPTADDASAATAANTPVAITLTGSDPDGDPITYAIVTPPAHGSLSGAIPALTYEPAAGFSGADSFTFKVNDGAGDSNIASVSLTIEAPVNLPPVVDAGSDATAILRPESSVKPYSNIIINHDEWTLTETGFAYSADAGKFARNLAHWITGGNPGRFLAYTNCAAGSVAEAFTGQSLRAAMEADGHTWETSSTIPFTLANLVQYDAVFFSANIVDNQVLIDYVNAGGTVYISAGTKLSGQDADVEAGWYNQFLNHFGLAYGYPYNRVIGTLPVYSNHPIFAGVHQLYYLNGNPVIVLDPSDPRTSVIDRFDFKNLMAIYSRSLERAQANLVGTVTDDGQPGGAVLQTAWNVVSGPGPVYFDDPSSPTTTASFSVPGTYVLRLSANDSAASSSAEVTITVESNASPTAYAGPDVSSPSPSVPVALAGEAADDGRPLGSSLRVMWNALSGPGTASFTAPDSQTTAMTASLPGVYVVQLTASDGTTAASDITEVRFGAQYANPAPQDLAAWWTGNHTAQDAVSGSSAEMLNDVHFSPGKVSEAFEFDGIDDALHVPASSDIDVGAAPAGMTVELWMKPRQLADRIFLAWRKDDAEGLFIQQAFGGQRIWVRIKDTAGQDHSILSPAFLTAGEWQHIAFTYDRVSGEARIYRNGILSVVQNLGTFTAQTSYDFYLGARPRDYLSCYDGCLDEVALYRRPLSADEILAIWQADIFGKCPLDGNTGPHVDAGPDLTVGAVNQQVNLSGNVTDDGLPAGHVVSTLWSKVAGPGDAVFMDASSATTTVSFDAAGVYLLKLSADDGAITTQDLVEAQVAVPAAQGYPSGLSAWWTANGHPHEFLQYGPDLQFFNGAAYGQGICSQGIHFDGVDDIVRIPASLATDVGVSQAFTIEFWFKRSREMDDVLLVYKNRGGPEGVKVSSLYNGSLMVANLVDVAGESHSFNTAAWVFTGQQWQHLALTYDAATGLGRLYRDGQLVREQSLGSFTPQTSYDVWLGSDPDRNYLGGDLDELSFYNRALTIAEIQGIYNAGAFGKSPVPANGAPTVSAGADQPAYVDTAVTLAATAVDDGLPNPPAALTYGWSVVSSPAGSSPPAVSGPVVSGSTFTFTFTFTAPGAYVLRLSAGDSELTGSDDVQVTVTTPPSAPPAVAITSPANHASLPAGTPFTLAATATDSDGTIAKVEFFQGAAKLGEATAPSTPPSTFTFTLTSGLPLGSYTFTARATDNAGMTATSAPVEVTVVADPGTPPFAEISTPAEDARISAPTAVTGVVASPILASWTLECRLKAADGETPLPWTTVATGTEPVGSLNPSVPQSLGIFDPTLLLNGIYELQLRAADAAGRTLVSGPITIVVEGNMKVGAFTLAFEDLSLPLAGIPIQLIRTYDSRDSRVGDFGPGWRLAVNNIRVQKNRNLSPGWYQTPQQGDGIQFYYVEPVQERIVTVAMPDGETHRFRAGAYVKVRPGDPDNASWALVVREGLIKFYPLGDTTSTLEPLDAANQLYDRFWLQGTGDQDIYAGEYGDLDFIPYNPARFRLTTKDGAVYILDERLGLLEMRDLNGNTLVLARDGQNRVTSIVSTLAPSSLPPAPGSVTTVTIHRDATGRVDYITDPAGRDLDYLYDAQGRLGSFANRELNVTQFLYELSDSLLDVRYSLLTRIIDPRGVSALRSEYDADGRLVKQIDADGRETVFNRGVDATGRFEKVRDRLGHETAYYYDDRGNVVLKIDPAGAQTSFAYYPDTDRVRFETDHYGNVKSFAYDARGNLTVETVGASAAEDPASPTTGYTTRTTCNERSAPTSITDPDGRVQTFTYDPATNNLLTHTTGAGGPQPATSTYTYLADGTLATVTDALGNVTSHAYDYAFSDAAFPSAVKQITVTVTDPAGAAGSDPANAAVTVLRATRALHDAQENQVAQIVTRTLPAGGTEDVVTRYLYDFENRLVATIQPDGKVAETRYNAIGKQSASVLWKSYADYQGANDTLARVTSCGYDDRGNQTTITYPDGTSETTHYDAENRRDWSQDRLGQTTGYQYDAVGRLRFTTFPGGASTETVYDLAGRVTDSYDELRYRTQYVYYSDGTPDASRRRQVIVAPDASVPSVTTYQYDHAGNVRYVTDPRGNTVETQYDEFGRLRFVIYPATDEHPSTHTETRYNALGQRVAVVDQEEKITRYRYDALGRLVEVRQYLDQSLAASDADFSLPTTHSSLVAPRYSFDELGHQTSQTDALGRVTSYWSDAVGRRTQRVLPDNATETLQYDDWGNLWKRTDFAGKTSVFTYDALNRLTTKTADTSHSSLVYGHAIARVEYDYDASGARTAARTYNKDNLLLYTESTPRTVRGWVDYRDAGGTRLDYTYYGNGLLQDTVSSTTNGVNLGYRYDGLNRLAFVDDATTGTIRTTSYTYNANGSLETVACANGVTHNYQYDALNRLRTLNVTLNLTTLHAYTYQLRASGHRQQVTENTGRTVSYAYDGIYRLTGETITGDASSNGSVSYTLDKVGNRLSRSSSVASVPSVVNTFTSRDWLNSDTYDANGNTTLSFGVTTQDIYDFEDRLIVRHKPDGSTINLSYDADGNRLQKTCLDASAQLVSSTYYLVDANNLTGYAQVVEEQTSTGGSTPSSTLKVHAYGSDLISQTTFDLGPSTFGTRFYAYDGHGSVRELTDDSGAITDTYTYDAFGVLIARTGTTDNAYLYRGEQWDADLGLYYLRARYLNPNSGRFWSMDSYEGSSSDPMSLHKYLYANADGVNNSDPSGNFTSMAELNFTAADVGLLATRIAVPAVRVAISPLAKVAIGVGFSSATAGVLTWVYHSTEVEREREKVKTELKEKSKGPILFYYGSKEKIARYVAVSAIRASARFPRDRKGPLTFPEGAYATDIPPFDVLYTQSQLSSEFYNGDESHDLSWFIAFAKNDFARYYKHQFIRHAPAGTWVPIEIVLFGPNLMSP